MKTPEEIMYERLVIHGDQAIIDFAACKSSMKEYAKNWVGQVIKEMHIGPADNLITYYHLAIDAQ